MLQCVLYRVADVLQRLDECCNVLQVVLYRVAERVAMTCSELQYVLRCVAVCCGVLYCTAVWCGVMQCFAV